MAYRLGLAMILAGAAFVATAAHGQTLVSGGPRPSVEVNLGAIDDAERANPGARTAPGKSTALSSSPTRLKAPAAAKAAAPTKAPDQTKVAAPTKGKAAKVAAKEPAQKFKLPASVTAEAAPTPTTLSAPVARAPLPSAPMASAPVMSTPLPAPLPPPVTAAPAPAAAAPSPVPRVVPSIIAPSTEAAAPAPPSSAAMATPPAPMPPPTASNNATIAAPPPSRPVTPPPAAAPPARAAALQPGAAAPPAVNAGGDLMVRFDTADATLGNDNERQLEALARRLANTEDRVQLRGYASASNADAASGARRLSLSRALAVRSYLIDKGIRSTRIDVRALGPTADSGPADRVDVSILGR